jgi:GTPase SAR1 family protein
MDENTRRDIKLIVLGNSNSGKTNLVNYLETGVFTGSRNTTHGLEVHRWIPDEKRFPNLKDIVFLTHVVKNNAQNSRI